jgi:glutathione S-transferase
MKLTYFDIRGLAEMSRLMFEHAGVKYEDERFSFSFGTPGDFSTIKRPEFDAAKEKGEFDAALGKVPILEVDGVKVGQSKAIERFVARKCGMMGDNEIEDFQIDALACHITDIKDAFNKAKNVAAEEKEESLKKWFAEGLPEWLGKVEKSLGAGGPFLVGKKLSYADVSYFQFLLAPKGFFDDAEGAAAAMKKCPRIAAACQAAADSPGIQAWIAKRPDSIL